MLTKKQIQLLDFIHKRLEKDGVPPSFDEMKDALDLRSKSGVHRLVTALEERGFIRKMPHRARAMEVIRLPDALLRRDAGLALSDQPSQPPMMAASAIAALELPMMGRIAAGLPIEAISDDARHVAVPSSMLSGRARHYTLEVKGDSMIDAGIHEGDIVVIREQDSVNNGDIVVALIEGYEATLKRYRRKGNMISLEAANPAYETRILPEGSIEVQGRLVGLIRSY